MTELLIRNISDTARWVAHYRAVESERADALFRDPLARRLAGARGEEIAAAMPSDARHTWPYPVRTYLFDQFITEQVQQGADMVINLAAGLDARPYRMALPASLHWVEIDLPELLDYKEEILRGEKPVCQLERIRLDLADVTARREVFAQLGRKANKALIVTEGLLVYLAAEEVAALARDLAAAPGFQYWAIDLVSPGLLSMLQKQVGRQLGQAGAPLKFGPPEGPPFFAGHGWEPADVRSMFKTAARLKRISLLFRLLARLPESKNPRRIWGGICLLKKR